MERKVVKVGAVKTDRNQSRSEPKVGVSCTCGLLVAWGLGCCATLRIPSRSEEAAITHAYASLGKVRNPNFVWKPKMAKARRTFTPEFKVQDSRAARTADPGPTASS